MSCYDVTAVIIPWSDKFFFCQFYTATVLF